MQVAIDTDVLTCYKHLPICPPYYITCALQNCKICNLIQHLVVPVYETIVQNNILCMIYISFWYTTQKNIPTSTVLRPRVVYINRQEQIATVKKAQLTSITLSLSNPMLVSIYLNRIILLGVTRPKFEDKFVIFVHSFRKTE